MKKAILAVGFGTTYPEAERACICPLEAALKAGYPGYDVFRAYTSRMILRKLRGQGIFIESEQEALERLSCEGYDEIAIVPTHIIPGGEYEKILAAARGIKVSEPLLACDEDLDWMAVLLGCLAAEEQRPLLLMGHGSEHAADAIYSRLRDRLPANVFLGCAQGKCTLEQLIPALEDLPERNLTLMPLMLVAGAHACGELAGCSDDSWKSILEARGFIIRVRMQGLGALPAVQKRFVEKAGRILT